MKITPEQWDSLQKIAETCMETQAFRQFNPDDLDDAGLYTLMTGFMFLYNTVRKECQDSNQKNSTDTH